MKKFFIYLILGILTSCSNKEVLDGKRIDVFQKTVTNNISNEKIQLDKPVNYQTYTNEFYNLQNLIPNIKYDLNAKLVPIVPYVKANVNIMNSGNIIVTKQFVYLTDSYGHIICADKSNGRLIWRTNSSPDRKSDIVSTYITYADKKIFVTTSFADLIILNAINGQPIRNLELKSPAKAQVRIYEDNLFSMQSDNSLQVFNLNTLAPKWQYSAPEEENGLIGLASVAVSDGIVVSAYKNGEVFALNLSTGALLWDYSITSLSVTESIAAMAHIKASPVISGNKVYIISNCGKSVCLDLQTGQVIWEATIGGGIYTPIISGNTMYFLSNENTLIALNNKNGLTSWALTLPIYKEAEYVWYAPVLTSSGIILANSLGMILQINPYTGRVLRTISTTLKICATPVIVDNTMYLLTTKGLYILK